MSINCSNIFINVDFVKYLDKWVDYCSEEIYTQKELIVKSKNANIYKVITKYGEFALKEQVISGMSTNEKNILAEISNDLLSNTAPRLFPYLYKTYACYNNLYMITPFYTVTLDNALLTPHSIEWWATFVYQIASAVNYLESKYINHNDLNFNNIMFQIYSDNYKELAICVIDFGSSVKKFGKRDNLPEFILGRDLNYFLHIISTYLPSQLQNLLLPLINRINTYKFPNEPKDIFELRRVNLTIHNPNTSGKRIASIIKQKYPYVTEKCNETKLNKLFGCAIGAVIGDSIGMPVEFNTTAYTIDGMYNSGSFKGLLSEYNLPAGTFTDDTQMALCIIDSYLKDKKLIPTTIASNFKYWYESGPLDVGIHTTKVLKAFNKDGSNWKKVSEQIYNENTEAASNGTVMRTWPISIIYNSNLEELIRNSILQCSITHLNNEAIWSAVLINCLLYFIINSDETNTKELYKKSLEKSLEIIKPHISIKYYNILLNAGNKNTELNGGKGYVYDTMETVLWCINNSNSYKDAILKCINIPGDTDTNASITGAVVGALYGLHNIPVNWINILDKPNKYNNWNGIQITSEILKNIVLLLSNCD
jgi:ADP-ribosyl-[dinitrogen reductase] hydrolase